MAISNPNDDPHSPSNSIRVENPNPAGKPMQCTTAWSSELTVQIFSPVVLWLGFPQRTTCTQPPSTLNQSTDDHNHNGESATCTMSTTIQAFHVPFRTLWTRYRQELKVKPLDFSVVQKSNACIFIHPDSPEAPRYRLLSAVSVLVHYSVLKLRDQQQ